MLIQITSKCNYSCRHCMQCSSPHGIHMTPTIVNNAFALAQALNCKMVVISGGEPTLHPAFLPIVDEACSRFMSVTVATNGSWLLGGDNAEVGKKLVERLDSHPNLFIQICADPRFYENAEKTQKIFHERFPEDGPYQSRVFIATEITTMMALGRAAVDVECLELAKNHTKATTSCLTAALVSAQLPLKEAIFALEARGKFCHPMVDYEGRIRWSESCCCPSFSNVPQDRGLTDADVKQIALSAYAWRPCGMCADYKKIFSPDIGPRYQKAIDLLGLEPPKGKDNHDSQEQPAQE